MGSISNKRKDKRKVDLNERPGKGGERRDGKIHHNKYENLAGGQYKDKKKTSHTPESQD